jgi:predicted DNA-binding transcriptional regulator AlpA
MGGDMNEKERLDSWKEIANYVGREARTCHKWQNELNFPVYSINKKSSRSRVFAFKSEIDQWFKERAEEQK